MTESIDCVVHRCSKQDEMYIYLPTGKTAEELPEELVKQVGRLTEVMELSLTEDSKLARAEPAKVISALQADGYYLQMPPPSHIDPKMYWGD